MRYFIDQDGDSHWYMIPEECRSLWYVCEMEGLENFDLAVLGAIRLDGHPNTISFINPESFGEEIGEWE